MAFDNIAVNFDDGRVIIDEYEVEFVDKHLLSTKEFELVKQIQELIIEFVNNKNKN